MYGVSGANYKKRGREKEREKGRERRKKGGEGETLSGVVVLVRLQ